MIPQGFSEQFPRKKFPMHQSRWTHNILCDHRQSFLVRLAERILTKRLGKGEWVETHYGIWPWLKVFSETTGVDGVNCRWHPDEHGDVWLELKTDKKFSVESGWLPIARLTDFRTTLERES